jgi:tripartite-type tricarboxylate transporter receptor subunit TctC
MKTRPGMRLARLARRLVTALGTLAVATGVAHAQPYPARPVTMVIPQAVGGTNDIVGRLIAQKLGEALGGSVVAENRPGAGGNIGTAYVAKAPRDGHTLMLTVSSAQAINPALYKNPGFDPVRDFVPISLIGAVPNVLVVNPAFPARTLKEFIEVTRAKPGFYQYASAGNGTLNHLLGEMLAGYAGVRLQHVPYKGVAPALNDLLGGQVQIAFSTPAAVLQHIKAGKLLPLGVSSPTRSPSLPNVPAIAETLPGYTGLLWIAVYAPQGIPAAVETQLQNAMKRVLDAADTREKLVTLGVDLANATPAQLATLLTEDLARWAKIVRESGATID